LNPTFILVASTTAKLCGVLVEKIPKNGKIPRFFGCPGKIFWVPGGISQQISQFWKGY
jgi:hypothetical protein